MRRNNKNVETLQATNVYEEARNRKNDLIRVRDVLLENIKEFPEGKIHVINNRGSVQYYVRMKNSRGNGEYLSKKEKEKIRIYLQKNYTEKILEVIEKEISGLTKMIETVGDFDKKIQQIYSEKTFEVKKHITPIDMSYEDKVSEWMSLPDNKKQMTDTNTLYETNNGEHVRSKSELAIANALALNGIPYKYEEALTLKNGLTIYPDFTILATKSRKLIYWEHRGMMDDREYCRHAVQRNKEYLKNGFRLGETLVITEETQNQPLGTDEISAVIDFLKTR